VVLLTAAALSSCGGDDSDEGAEIVEGVGSQAFSVQFSGLWAHVDDRSFFAQWYTLDDVDQDNLPQSQALAQAVVEDDRRPTVMD
jgi:hypothetical protein